MARHGAKEICVTCCKDGHIRCRTTRDAPAYPPLAPPSNAPDAEATPHPDAPARRSRCPSNAARGRPHRRHRHRNCRTLPVRGRRTADALRVFPWSFRCMRYDCNDARSSLCKTTGKQLLLFYGPMAVTRARANNLGDLCQSPRGTIRASTICLLKNGTTPVAHRLWPHKLKPQLTGDQRCEGQELKRPATLPHNGKHPARVLQRDPALRSEAMGRTKPLTPNWPGRISDMAGSDTGPCALCALHSYMGYDG